MWSQRPVEVITPLGGAVLLFQRMAGSERLSTPFEYQVDLLSPNEQIKFENVLGQPVTVKLMLPMGKTRYFNGLVSRFSQAGRVGAHALYRATLRPWLWFLTRTSNCRIYQDQSAVDIVKTVFRDHGFTDFDEALSGSYRKLEYCVQYRESDFNFVCRLLEHEGIYYYFKHEDGKHTLVLSDSYSSHEPFPGYDEIPYYPPTENLVRDEDHVSDWGISQEVQPGAYALNDFDFERPRAGLSVKSSQSRPYPHSDFEVYDYPGDYLATSDGDAYARTRIEELQARFEEVQGSGNARGIAPGTLFKLAEHPRNDQNREYLVVSAQHTLESQAYESGTGAVGGPAYSCSFGAIDSRQTFRPPRISRRPTVQGPQTAIVVGKAGEEIWTDKYGRVKVQFHWDREGKSDEKSSCWVRVAQVWAGKNWGAIHIPRIGQEVVVDFLEGDPDRPLITGRVYNADNMPPYDLPANQSQAGLKSRSTKGGGPDNFNEIRFEDKKGEELLTLHAEKNQAIAVENDETHSVGHDRKKSIGNDETTEVKNNRTENVAKNESITVGENRTESVGKNESITIGEGRTESVGKDESITIGGSRTEDVSKDESITIGANRSENVAKNETVEIGENRQLTVGKNDTLSVGKSLAIDAGDQVVVQVGDASIIMKKNGDIVISGKNITLDASGKINAKASSDLIMKGSKILQN